MAQVVLFRPTDPRMLTGELQAIIRAAAIEYVLDVMRWNYSTRDALRQ